VYDAAAEMRAAALLPWLKPQAAVDMLTKAAALIVDGAEVQTAMGSAEDSFAEWSRLSGVDYKDPEQMAVVYRAVDAMKKKEAEQAARQEAVAVKARTKGKARRRGR